MHLLPMSSAQSESTGVFTRDISHTGPTSSAESRTDRRFQVSQSAQLYVSGAEEESRSARIHEKELLAYAAALESKNTDLEKALAIACEASTVKSRFLASVSHEFRTPLNGIIGFSELLQDEGMGPLTTGQKECVDDLLGCSRHLLTLVNQILDLTAIEAGRMTFRYEAVSRMRVGLITCAGGRSWHRNRRGGPSAFIRGIQPVAEQCQSANRDRPGARHHQAHRGGAGRPGGCGKRLGTGEPVFRHSPLPARRFSVRIRIPWQPDPYLKSNIGRMTTARKCCATFKGIPEVGRATPRSRSSSAL